MYKRGKRALRNPKIAPKFLFDWQEAPDGLDYRKRADRAVAVRAASAAADLQWSVNDRVNEWGKPDMPSHEWQRYYANKWVDVAEDSWLKDHPAAWALCRGTWESSDANPFVITVDMALKQDSVAVDRCELLPDGRIAVTAKIWRAADSPDKRINHAEVWEYIKDQAHGLGFRGVVYDPRFFELPARFLEDDGILCIQFDQSPARMTPACGETYKRILARTIVWDGDPDFNTHVTSAVPRPQERGFTLSKGRSKRHIDACIAMCMGVWVLQEVPEETSPPPATAPATPPTSGQNIFRPGGRLKI